MFVGFNIMVECDKLVKNGATRNLLVTGSQWTTHKMSHEKHMLEVEKSSARRHLVTYLATRLTHEMHC